MSANPISAAIMFGWKAMRTISSANADAKAIKAQGVIQQRQADLQTRQAEFLNQQAETRGKLAERERQLNTARNRVLRRDQSRARGGNRALLAARGVDPSAGSALLAQEDIAARGEFEALLAKASGLQSSISLDQQAHSGRFSAQQTFGEADLTRSSAALTFNRARRTKQEGLLKVIDMGVEKGTSFARGKGFGSFGGGTS